MEIGSVLFLAILLLLIGYLLGRRTMDHHWREQLPKIRNEAVKGSRSVLTGKFSEQLAPFMPDFPYSPTEARFIGSPIDFIVFQGMDGKEIEEVVFVEVKTGKAQLSKTERILRDAIKAKRVRWEEYRVGE